jgi:hypothetical protein
MAGSGDGIMAAAGSINGSSSARMINDQRPVHRIKGTLLWVVTIAAWFVMLAFVLNSVFGISKEAKKIRKGQQ